MHTETAETGNAAGVVWGGPERPDAKQQRYKTLLLNVCHLQSANTSCYERLHAACACTKQQSAALALYALYPAAPTPEQEHSSHNGVPRTLAITMQCQQTNMRAQHVYTAATLLYGTSWCQSWRTGRNDNCCPIPPCAYNNPKLHSGSCKQEQTSQPELLQLL